MISGESSGGYYGRFDECALTSGYNTTICVYHCQCKMAAQCANIHFCALNGNFTLCGVDVVAVF